MYFFTVYQPLLYKYSRFFIPLKRRTYQTEFKLISCIFFSFCFSNSKLNGLNLTFPWSKLKKPNKNSDWTYAHVNFGDLFFVSAIHVVIELDTDLNAV